MSKAAKSLSWFDPAIRPIGADGTPDDLAQVNGLYSMSGKGKLVAAANRALRTVGIAIVKSEMDFDCRLTGADQLAQLYEALAASFLSWMEKQAVFEACNQFDAVAEISSFYEDYLRAPYRDQQGGSRFNNALWLSLIAKTLQPLLIVDSGTYTGASAWALARGAPNAKIFSFDIDLSHLRSKSPNVQYIQNDWTSYTFARSETRGGLCYFDDHVDQAKRLLEAHERGFYYAIFDDDYPITAFAQMARDATVLPKIEFMFDPHLRDGDVVEWSVEGSKRTWVVDADYLSRACQAILATERLPNTSLITGIHQTPYRIIRLAR